MVICTYDLSKESYTQKRGREKEKDSIVFVSRSSTTPHLDILYQSNSYSYVSQK